MEANNIDKLLAMQDEKNEVNESVFVELEHEFEEDLGRMRASLDSHELDSISKLKYFNMIIFGPSGAGKSSFVKTLFNAYHDEFYDPIDISKELVIKSTESNEGTTKYSIFTLKDFECNVMKVGGRELIRKVAGLRLFDTRGQIYLDQNEKAYFDIMLTVININLGVLLLVYLPAS